MKQEMGIEEQERGAWLMSLALDQRLGPDEAQALDKLLAEDAGLGDEWTLWQALDAKLTSAPRVAPPAGFVTEFERRRAQADRRRRLWFGVGVAVMAAALGGSLLVGLLGASAYVMFRGSDVLVALVHGAAYWYTAIQTQISALLLTAQAVFSSSQVLAIMTLYITLAVAALYGWLRFLRRTLREVTNAESYAQLS